MNLAVHPVFVCRGSRKSLFALPPTAARRICNIGSATATATATATLCSLLFTILRLLRLFHIVVAPHCKFKLVPRAISFEFDAGYLTPAPNEEVFDDYDDDDALLAQIIVVDDDPLDDETSSEPQDASRPSAGRSQQSSHRCAVVRAATQVLNAGTPFGP